MRKSNSDKWHIATQTIHSGEAPKLDPHASGDVAMPIHLASTFARKLVEEPTGGFEYSRSGNPTRLALEERLAALEGAKYGLAFASGLAAETSLILALLKTGDHVVAFDDLYGGTRRLFTRIFAERFGIDFTFVDATTPENVLSAIRENTRLVWLETPTNPLLKLCDIETICESIPHKKIKVVVDNTFASPVFQNPLKLGADVVLHSTTKYINGHSDSVGGALMTNDAELFEKLQFTQNSAGAILSPFDSYMVLRGSRTLAARMQEHQRNAMLISEFLAGHPKVKRVIYPGHPSHPQFELAKKQMSGFGGMISFELDGSLEEAKHFVENLELFALAESLGGVESLVELPALMTHASVPPEVRQELGIADSLIRLSVGIEDSQDLLEDLKRALK
ncbi:MAG: cystathionine gamma-synthase [Calditrichia bacterium]